MSTGAFEATNETYHGDMASTDDVEPRVAALEVRADVLEGGQGAVLGLLRDQGLKLVEHDARFDRIDATLDGHTATLAAHSAVLAAHSARFDQVDATLAEHTATLAGHTATLAGHTARFDQVDAKLDLIVGWIQSQPD
jgi:hypothetical protein